MMKANPISSGFVTLLFLFALWGLFSFCILWYCFCTKRLLARVVMETQHVEIIEPAARWENVTALACLHWIPLAALVLFFFLHSLCFDHFFCSLSSVSVHPDTTLYLLSFVSLPFFVLWLQCCVCAFFFSVWFCSWNYFSVETVYLFVVHLFVGFVFLFQYDAALLLESQSANANEIISVCTASVPVILFIAIYYRKN